MGYLLQSELMCSQSLQIPEQLLSDVQPLGKENPGSTHVAFETFLAPGF